MTYRKSVRKQPCCSIRRRDWAATALTPRDERSEERSGDPRDERSEERSGDPRDERSEERSGDLR